MICETAKNENVIRNVINAKKYSETDTGPIQDILVIRL